MGTTLGKIAMSIVMSLITESVIKGMAVAALKYLVKSSKNELVNDLAQPVIEALEK
jgi:hypothetical protein